MVGDPLTLLAITALLEARLLQVIADPSLDPLEASSLPAHSRDEELVALTDANEAAAGKLSLDAELRHWKDGRPILARDWVEELQQDVWDSAKKQGFSCFLMPIKKVLREGNEAQRWLRLVDQGLDVRAVMQQAIQELEQQELALADELCQPLIPSLVA
jgi:predicted glutamate--cysteine ligase